MEEHEGGAHVLGQRLECIGELLRTRPREHGPFGIRHNGRGCLRDSLGEIRRFASRLDLASMTPRPELASSGYVLADTEGDSPELVVLVDGGPTTIDLTGISGSLRVEWFDPLTEVTTIGDNVSGGAPVELDPADGRDAVVHLRR